MKSWKLPHFLCSKTLADPSGKSGAANAKAESALEDCSGGNISPPWPLGRGGLNFPSFSQPGSVRRSRTYRQIAPLPTFARCGDAVSMRHGRRASRSIHRQRTDPASCIRGGSAELPPTTNTDTSHAEHPKRVEVEAIKLEIEEIQREIPKWQ